MGSRGVRRETSGGNSGGVSAVERKNSTAVFSGRRRRDWPVLGSKWSFDERLTGYPCCSGEFKVGGGTIRKSWGLRIDDDPEVEEANELQIPRR